MSAAASLATEPATAPLDLASLLAPIAGPSPAGAWIREDPAYDRLIETRRTENATLPQGIWKRDVKRADWRAVSMQAAAILATRSKDLQIAVWLVEAETHRRGFAGLADGFTLIAGLARDFWPDLYPSLDPRDPDARNAPLEWLNEKLPILLQQVPVTRSGSAADIAYCWTDYVNGQRHEVARKHDPRAAAQAEEAGRVSLPAFTESALHTPPPLLVAIYRDLVAAQTALGTLQGLLDELAGRAAPSLVGLARQIEEIGSWVRALLIERHALPMVEIERVEETMVSNARPVEYPAPAEPDAAPAAVTSGPITSREDAFRRLAEAADYLFQAEPHSPVPYLVQRAIIWGQMPFHELLPELMRNPAYVSMLMELMGVQESQ
jgi:type VI secretion system protein ImpA